MKTAVLRVGLLLQGCRSLKEKRKRVAGLRDRFGKHTSMAVCESAHADELQRSEWSFVACGGSAVVVEKALAEVERYLTSSVDAQVLQMDRQWLN